MAVNNKVDIFTTAMRSEFANAYEAVAVPAEFAKYTTVVPSAARIEHYTWMSPSPGLAKYQGHRRYGKIDSVRYSVENSEFDAAFEVLLRDIDDDQTGGYALKPKELAERAKVFPSRWVLKHLAAGTSRACFDGTNFFANSHTIGTGDNLLTYDCAGNDAVTHKIVALHHGGSLKPLIWQDRKAPSFQDNAGSSESREAKTVKYWIDMEGEAAFGYWWDAIHMTITDTPSITEMHGIFQAIEDAFRGFLLPKSLSSDEGEYIHEQREFNASNLCLVASPKLATLLRQALNAEWVPQSASTTSATTGVSATNNLWKGWASYVITNYL